VRALASALALAGIFFGVPDSDDAECVSGGLLVILHVYISPIGRGYTLFHSGEDIEKLGNFRIFLSFLTDLPSSRGRGLAQDGYMASQVHQARETN